MFPAPTPVRRVLCDLCRTHWVRVDRLVAGAYGEDCATKLGLIAATPRLRVDAQSGPDLLDHLRGEPDDEPDDCCDGWDR